MDFPDDIFSGCGSRLKSQLLFSAEIDKMTSVYRRTLLLDRSRRENDAEHSWHIAVMALLFEEYAVEKVDIRHAVEMLLVHDLIEIYAGDTFAYDIAGGKDKHLREQSAAEKLFALLPEDQSVKIKQLWQEFDAAATADAKYANCLDRLQPFYHNMLTDGHTWRNADIPVTSAQVRKRTACIKEFMPQLYCWVENCIAEAEKRGWIA